MMEKHIYHSDFFKFIIELMKSIPLPEPDKDWQEA